MFTSDVSSWNLRDLHMAETLEALSQRLSAPDRPAKVVVWAHNSHLGDARATQMGARGELNLGQVVRQRYGQYSFHLGFSTYQGTVTAASSWGGPAERKQVRPGLPGSYEAFFRQVRWVDFMVDLHAIDPGILPDQALERAIGVIYMPESERASHYFEARLARQFDAVVHFDETRAVEPLERSAAWVKGETETYPFGV